MEIFSNRLATFDAEHPSKRRSSGELLDFDTAWPHAKPTPEELADAGFYHAPTALSPDNTACFLCQRALDGWEEEDDPLTEHLRLSQGCGWAIMMDIARKPSDADDIEDPTSTKIAEARQATFRGWPHDGKRGWTCKANKMVAAGWYYCPTDESEDFVSCPYCKLSLDGWEPKDDPFDEHYRRSKDCPFFQFAVKKTSRNTRAKKTRSAKASTTSSHSATPAPSETTPAELDAPTDEHTTSNATTTKKPRATRKGTKPKSKTSRSKATPDPIPEPPIEAPVQDTSYEEPEQQFEIPAGYPSRKRPSDAMDDAQELAARQMMTSSRTDQSASRSAKRTKKTADDRRVVYLDRVEIDRHDSTTPPAPIKHPEIEKTDTQSRSIDELEGGEGLKQNAEPEQVDDKTSSSIPSHLDIDNPEVDSPHLDAVLQADVDQLAQSLPQSEDRAPSSPIPDQTEGPLEKTPEIPTFQAVLPMRTPVRAPSPDAGKLRTTTPWSEIDIDEILFPNGEEENDDAAAALLDAKGQLTEAEKDMTVEEWIRYTAEKAEAKLKGECERLIGIFEREGARAMRTLEGIECNE